MKYKIFVNGKFLLSSKAKISVLETGFLYGYGLFETMRSYGGLIYRLSEHIERLVCSARFFKISQPFPKRKIAEVVQQTLEVNNLQDAYIKVILSGGTYTGKLSQPSAKPNLIIIAQPFVPPPDRWYSQGVTAIIASIRRNSSSSIYAHKTLNFLENLLAKREAEEKGCQEALFLNTQDYLAEGSTSNLFLVKEGRVITPCLESGILPGITRRVVIDLCAQVGIPCRERKVRLNELYRDDEAFLTSSLRGILPLTRVNSRMIGKGKAGGLTQTLMEEYRKDICAS